MKDNTNINLNLEKEDWSGKLWELDKKKNNLYSIIKTQGMGDHSSSHRYFNWIEDVENNRRVKPTAVSGNVLTITKEESARLIKDDILWSGENNTYLRVTTTPISGSTSVEVVQIVDEENESAPVSADVANKDFFKFSSAKSEGSKDGDSYIDNPEDYNNTMTTFEDFAEISKTKANEDWQVSGFSHREYEKTKKLLKHKQDINMQLYIGKHFDKGTRQMSKGINNFNGLQVQTGYAFKQDGSLDFTPAMFDNFIVNKVKKYSKAQSHFVSCNNHFLLYIHRLIEKNVSLMYNANGTEDKYGFSVRKLVHFLTTLTLSVDEDLNDLYPNHVAAYFFEINKVGMRHLQNLNTSVELAVQAKKDNCILDKIYTVGGGLQLVKSQNHTMLKLGITNPA